MRIIKTLTVLICVFLSVNIRAQIQSYTKKEIKELEKRAKANDNESKKELSIYYSDIDKRDKAVPLLEELSTVEPYRLWASYELYRYSNDLYKEEGKIRNKKLRDQYADNLVRLCHEINSGEANYYLAQMNSFVLPSCSERPDRYWLTYSLPKVKEHLYYLNISAQKGYEKAKAEYNKVKTIYLNYGEELYNSHKKLVDEHYVKNHRKYSDYYKNKKVSFYDIVEWYYTLADAGIEEAKPLYNKYRRNLRYSIDKYWKSTYDNGWVIDEKEYLNWLKDIVISWYKNIDKNDSEALYSLAWFFDYDFSSYYILKVFGSDGFNEFEGLSDILSSFSYFAYDKIKTRMEEWQKKKEYETTAQWKERVTEANRQEQLTKVIDNVRKEYISQKAPKVLKGNLGMFDADYGVYPINASGINNTFYAQVPLGEAQAFKENWDKVVMQPTYGVVDDQLGILSCTFKLGNKTYQSTRNYSNDNDEDMAITLPPLEINLGEEEKNKSEHRIIQVDNSIDLQIPVTNAINTNTFAVIIGNENYQRVSKVEFALNDAKIFAKYCQKTLGLPKNNIRSYTDATYGTMLAALKDISDIAKAYNGDLNVIFYYAGHGIPNGKGNAFLLPIDADGTQLEVCLAVNVLYKKLNELKAKKTIVLMDACFSGAQRGEGVLMAARGVAIKAKQDVPQGNSVVFCAANDEETAFPYQEKGHGMFTYFLLKKLQETKGETTLGELVDYVTTNVGKQSVVVNRKKQTPTVVPSSGATGWQSETLK
jgi:hypothetical protein